VFRPQYSVPLADGRILELGPRTLVMGILNVTPDSFSDGVAGPDAAIDLALRMEDEGADLIDVGGESTRPGADPVSAAEELTRVMPVITRLANQLRIPLSIDTSKSIVARAALDAGAAIVNDVSGLQNDPELARIVARARVPIVLMHMRGTPKTMYAEATYTDVVGDVAAELRCAIDAACAAGIRREAIIADPGVGFAKRAEHSYGVLAGLPRLVQVLDRPLLVGASRKSFLRAALGDRPAAERDWGTAAAVAAAVLGGAHIVRVHAVREMVQVVSVVDRIRNAMDQQAARTRNHEPGTEDLE